MTKEIFDFGFSAVDASELESFQTATVIGFVFVELVRNFFQEKEILIPKMGWYILAVTVVLSWILRTLKRSTSLLDEEGRS